MGAVHHPALLGTLTASQRIAEPSSDQLNRREDVRAERLIGIGRSSTGTLNTGSKPLRTNSLPSLRLTKTAIGPGFSGFSDRRSRSEQEPPGTAP